MLQNAYFLAKIGADTAENEQHFAEILPRTGNYPTGPPGPQRVRWAAAAPSTRPRRRRRSGRGGTKDGSAHCKFCNFKFFTNFWQNLHILKLFLQIFGGLVLGCIKTKFCKKICVGQHFSSSTRCAHFCTTPSSTF